MARALQDDILIEEQQAEERADGRGEEITRKEKAEAPSSVKGWRWKVGEASWEIWAVPLLGNKGLNESCPGLHFGFHSEPEF